MACDASGAIWFDLVTVGSPILGSADRLYRACGASAGTQTTDIRSTNASVTRLPHLSKTCSVDAAHIWYCLLEVQRLRLRG